MNKFVSSASLFFIVLSVQCGSAESISRSQALDLMEQCKIFRELEIAPLKKIEVDKCVEKGKELPSCQRFYKDFGETYLAANGYQQIGMFWDAPICKQALELEKYFRLYPGKDSFN